MKAYDGVSRLQYCDTYHIYVLKHPDTEEVFYVGQTRVSLSYRLTGHIAEAKSGKGTEKCKFIRDILSLAKKPIIESIEQIQTFSYLDTLEIHLIERRWIKNYESKCKLLNIMGIGIEINTEYNKYLNCLAQRSVPTKYYYCGRDRVGDPVYDKQRILADELHWKGDEEKVPEPLETKYDFKGTITDEDMYYDTIYENQSEFYND